MRSFLLLSLTLFIIAFAVTIIAIPSNSDFALDNPLWNGMYTFARVYKPMPVKAINADKLPPNSTLLIIGPSLNFTHSEALSIKSFVLHGGTLILLDDYGTGNQLLKLMDIHIRFAKSVLRDPLFKYKSSALPLIKTIDGKKLVFNYGTVLKVGEGKCLAWSSPFSYLDLNDNGVHDPHEPVGPFCVAAVVRLGRGRVIVIADSSLLINSMIKLGNNEQFVMKFVKGRLYIVVDKWSRSLYTVVRSVIVDFFSNIVKTSYKYVIVLYSLLAMFITAQKLYAKFSMKRRVVELDEVIKDVLAKHPEWDPVTVRRLAEEVMNRE